MQKWTHPGGKLREVGAESLTDAELLAILISTGTKGKTAEEVAKEILDRFGSFKGMANQPLEKFLAMKGLGDVKIIMKKTKLTETYAFQPMLALNLLT
jgi:DNA repair protein RadC